MLSIKDCCDFCALTEDEISAIAEHEHISEISAAGFGGFLLQSEEGISEIKRFIRDDIVQAKLHHRPGKAKNLEGTLLHFSENHHS